MRTALIFQTTIRKAISFILETIAPKDPEIKAIEDAGFERFDAKAARSRSSDLGNDVICLYAYKDPLVKKAVLEVKSYGNKTVASLLGKAVYETLIQEILERARFEDFRHPLLAPIPMTAKNIRERGWNQCLLIARALKEHDVFNAFELSPDALSKTRATDDQVGKGRRKRFINLKDCFEASERVRGRNVIVLDDICTTGATFAEATRALKAAGARKTICVALAH